MVSAINLSKEQFIYLQNFIQDLLNHRLQYPLPCHNPLRLFYSF